MIVTVPHVLAVASAMFLTHQAVVAVRLRMWAAAVLLVLCVPVLAFLAAEIDMAERGLAKQRALLAEQRALVAREKPIR